MSEMAEMEAAVEAILFVSNDPVPRSRLLDLFGEGRKGEAEEALAAVLERYRQREDSGVMVDEVAGGIRLVTRPDLHAYLRRFYEASGGNKLSMPALETLAIVAYRQPVTAPEIAELRGVGSAGVLKTLLERRLIRVAGRKEVVGKPFLYATTREFLMSFGLRSLKELPPLEQLEELFGGDPEASAEPGPADLEEQASIESTLLEEAEEAEHERREAEADAFQILDSEARELPPDAPPPPDPPRSEEFVSETDGAGIESTPETLDEADAEPPRPPRGRPATSAPETSESALSAEAAPREADAEPPEPRPSHSPTPEPEKDRA